MTSAISGVGAEFQLGDGAGSEAFTKIAEVTSISGPELSSEQTEVTSLDSTSGYKEFIPGLLDGGAVSFDFNYVAGNTNQELIRSRVSSATQTVNNYRIKIPSSPEEYVTFAAIVESYSTSFSADSAVTVSASVKISGAPTWT